MRIRTSHIVSQRNVLTKTHTAPIPLGAPCWTWVGCWTSRQYLTSRSIGSGDITAAKHEFLSLRPPLAGGAISSPRHVGRVPVCPQSCIFFAALYRAPTLERRRTGEMVMRCEEWLFGTSNRSTRSGFRVNLTVLSPPSQSLA